MAEFNDQVEHLRDNWMMTVGFVVVVWWLWRRG